MVSNFLPAVRVPDSFTVFLLTDSVGMLGGEEKIPGTRRAGQSWAYTRSEFTW